MVSTKYRGNSETKIRQPVSSTYRRGARAYHAEYPRDFGPRIAYTYTVNLVSDTNRPPIRQGGREISTPRPYETYPFHPPALFTSYAKFNFYLNIKINANECYLYVILVLVLITAVIAVCFLLFVQSIVIICMARKLNKLRERYVLTPYCSCVERSRK